MDRSKQLEAARVAMQSLLQGLLDDGHEDQDLSNVMFAWALAIMASNHGRLAIAEHLRHVADLYANEDQDVPGDVKPRH